MSNLKSTSGPCIRTMGSPPKEVSSMLGDAYRGMGTSREAYCAAYISYLRAHALEQVEASASKGGFVNYASLPQGFIGEGAWCAVG